MVIHSFRRSLGISEMFCLSLPPPPLLLLLKVQGELTCTSDSLHPPNALPALLMRFGAEFTKLKRLLEVRVDELMWNLLGTFQCDLLASAQPRWPLGVEDDIHSMSFHTSFHTQEMLCSAACKLLGFCEMFW